MFPKNDKGKVLDITILASSLFIFFFSWVVKLCRHKIFKSPFMICSMNIKLLEVSMTIKPSPRSTLQMEKTLNQ